MDIENVLEMDVSIENNEENIDVDISEAGPQGLSAYEIYTKQGGTLTETEWLESLKGQNGITPSITIGNTQTLEAGSQATVQKTGTNLNPVFTFGIPQGIKGDTGTTPELQIGNVQTGNQSSATITGTSENPILNLTLQKGDKGDTGSSALNYTIVHELPTEDIQESTLYFVPNSTPEEENLYDEYAYINNKWEKLGSKSIDLSDYYNKTEVDNKLTDKQDNLTAGTNIEITSGNVINNTIPFSSNKYNGGLNLGTTNPTMSSDSVSVGYASSATNSQSVVLGAYVNNSKYSTIAIGSRAQPNYNYSMVFGYQATATKTNQAVFGSTSANINEAAIYTSSGLKNLATEDYVNNAISTAIGDVLGGSY